MTRIIGIPFTAILVLFVMASGAQAAATCQDADGDGSNSSFCPYGYMPKSTAITDNTILTVENCCERNTAMKSFPACKNATSGGTTGVQAPTFDDISWSMQDGSGYTRSLGRYKAMCFNVLVNDNGCLLTDPCCTKKRPSYVQFKLPVVTADGAGTNKCKLSYGSPVATVNGIKRITKWTEADKDTKFFNVPISWKKNAKATAVCIYSDYTADASCDFEDICGLKTDDTLPVPNAEGNYDDGCELRIVGRAVAGSAACCTPTFSVDAFDSNAENRVAGADVTQIELHGV